MKRLVLLLSWQSRKLVYTDWVLSTCSLHFLTFLFYYSFTYLTRTFSPMVWCEGFRRPQYSETKRKIYRHSRRRGYTTGLNPDYIWENIGGIRSGYGIKVSTNRWKRHPRLTNKIRYKSVSLSVLLTYCIFHGFSWWYVFFEEKVVGPTPEDRPLISQHTPVESSGGHHRPSSSGVFGDSE